MAFALGFRDVDVKRTGVRVTVPNHPKAQLMYYLNCMCTALDLSRTSQNLQRLRNNNNYWRTIFAAVSSVMIGSVRANVTTIMCYKMNWLKKYYTRTHATNASLASYLNNIKTN